MGWGRVKVTRSWLVLRGPLSPGFWNQEAGGDCATRDFFAPMPVLTVDSTLGPKVTDHEVAAGIVNGGPPTARRSLTAAEGAKGGEAL